MKKSRVLRRLRSAVVGSFVIVLALMVGAPASNAAVPGWTTLYTFHPENSIYYSPCTAAYQGTRAYGEAWGSCSWHWPFTAWSKDYYEVPAGKSVDRVKVRFYIVKGYCTSPNVPPKPDFKLTIDEAATYWTWNVTNTGYVVDTTYLLDEIVADGYVHSFKVGFADLGDREPYCSSGALGYIDWVKLEHYAG